MNAQRPGGQPGLAQRHSSGSDNSILPDNVPAELIQQLTNAVMRREGRSLRGDEFRFLCPVHDDRHPSARWNPIKAAWHCDACNAGGGAFDLAAKLDIDQPNRGVEPIPFNRPERRALNHRQPGERVNERQFLYTDRHDGPVLTVHRKEFLDREKKNGKTPKSITQEYLTADGAWVWKQPVGLVPPPFHLPALLAAPKGSTVFIVEGEPLAELLESWGLIATCNVGGASKWQRDYGHYLAGLDVVILPDNDDPGRKHAEQVRDSVRSHAASIRVIDLPDLPPTGDIVDWARQGRTCDDLLKLVSATPPDPSTDQPDDNAPTLPAVAPTTARLVSLSDVRPERIDWLWRARLARGKLVVMEGDPGLGKSTMTLTLAAAVSTGDPFPGETERREPAGVLLLSAEDGIADTLVPRLNAAGADLSRIRALTGIPDGDTDRPVSIPCDVQRIEEAIVAHGVTLVIFDPVVAYLGAEINSNQDQDVRRALAALTDVAERTGACIVLIRHLNKASGRSAIYRGGGSIGISGAARFVMLVARDPDDPDRRLVATVKSNLAAEADTIAYRLIGVPGTDVARIVWEGTSHHRADALVREPVDDDEPRSRLDEAKDFLLAELAGGARPSAEVMAAAKREGISDKTLRGAREAMGIKPQRDGFGKGGAWVWRLPPDTIDAPPDPKKPIDAYPTDKGTYESGGASMVESRNGVAHDNIMLDTLDPAGSGMV